MRSVQLSQDVIMDAAFFEWGKNNFAHMSLASLANNLGVSKTALYRHFKNKDDILSRMKERVMGEYLQVAETYCARAPFESLEQAVKVFYSHFFTFFLKRPEYFMFFIIFIAKQQESAGREFREMLKRIENIFRNLLQIDDFDAPITKDGGEGDRIEVLPVQVGFLYTTHTYWLSYLLHKNRTIGEEEAEQAMNDAIAFTLGGIAREQTSPYRPIRWEDFISVCEVLEDELSPPDKIFSAIAENVAADGLWNTTLEKIASQLDMSKSSLYFYFKNKEAMLSEMLERERIQIEMLYRNRKSFFPNPMERLFCYALVVSSYLLKKPALLTALDWIRLQGIRINMQKPDLEQMESGFAFLKDEFHAQSIELYGLRTKEHISLFNMQIVREVMSCFKGGLGRNEIYKRVNALFHCFYYGIGGNGK